MVAAAFADFPGAAFAGVDFTSAAFAGADFAGAAFAGAAFAGAAFAGAAFAGAAFAGADFAAVALLAGAFVADFVAPDPTGALRVAFVAAAFVLAAVVFATVDFAGLDFAGLDFAAVTFPGVGLAAFPLDDVAFEADTFVGAAFAAVAFVVLPGAAAFAAAFFGATFAREVDEAGLAAPLLERPVDLLATEAAEERGAAVDLRVAEGVGVTAVALFEGRSEEAVLRAGVLPVAADDVGFALAVVAAAFEATALRDDPPTGARLPGAFAAACLATDLVVDPAAFFAGAAAFFAAAAAFFAGAAAAADLAADRPITAPRALASGTRADPVPEARRSAWPIRPRTPAMAALPDMRHPYGRAAGRSAHTTSVVIFAPVATPIETVADRRSAQPVAGSHIHVEPFALAP